MLKFFFKKKEKIDLNNWEVKLLIKVFEFNKEQSAIYLNQINEGIIESIRLNKDIPNYIDFKLNIDLLNKYEKKEQTPFCFDNIKIFDLVSQKYIVCKIHIGYGVVLGIEIENLKNVKLDLEKININSIFINSTTENDLIEIKDLFTTKELNALNNNEIYKIELNNNLYFHLKDLDDGDFLGINLSNELFEIKHDPFEITLLNREKLISYLK